MIPILLDKYFDVMLSSIILFIFSDDVFSFISIVKSRILPSGMGQSWKMKLFYSLRKVELFL
ncbi:MAG: hypothetical protein Ct9H90mP3_5290 [Flammeovirgaceae bacterium]|nr:MAG: hypothetical protein Ct9H90mP3_5290 [Flammeovirgaceae bacterium]